MYVIDANALPLGWFCVVVCLAVVLSWKYRGRIDDDEREMLDNIKHLDNYDESTNLYTDMVTCPLGVRTKHIARDAARLCRGKFAFGVRNAANELVARKFVYDYITNLPDMRRTDVCNIVHLATMFSFVPSSFEVAIKRMERTDVYANRWFDYLQPSRTWFEYLFKPNVGRG